MHLRLVVLTIAAMSLIACQPQQAAPAAPKAGEKPAEKAAAPAAAKPAEMAAFKLGLVSKTAQYWPAWIAQDKGFFAEEKVAPEVIIITPSANLIQQLGAGQLNVGQADAAQMIRAADKGANLKFVAGGVSAALYRLMAQPDIKTVADLKGKTIVVDSASGQTKYMVQQFLRSKGIKDNEYSFIYSGSTTDRFSQLRSRAVASAILTQPFDFTAEDEGFSMLGDISDFMNPWTFNAVEVNTDWAKDHGDEVTRYIRALIKGGDFLLANKAESIQVLMKLTQVSESEATRTYDYYMKHKAVVRKLPITDESMKSILDYMVDVGDFKEPPPASKYIDRSYWEKATKS